MIAISSWETYKAYRGADTTLKDLNDDVAGGVISGGTFLAVILSYGREDKHKREIEKEAKLELRRRKLIFKKEPIKKVKKIKKALIREQGRRKAIWRAEKRESRRFKDVPAGYK